MKTTRILPYDIRHRTATTTATTNTATEGRSMWLLGSLLLANNGFNMRTTTPYTVCLYLKARSLRRGLLYLSPELRGDKETPGTYRQTDISCNSENHTRTTTIRDAKRVPGQI